MRNLLNPKWLPVINTLPIILLFILAAAEYSVIESLLSIHSKQLWVTCAVILGVLAVGNFAYSLYLIKAKREISVTYAFSALVIFTAYLYFYMWIADDLIPFDIPQWMYSGNIMLYGGTFLMPTLAYAMFVIVVHYTPDISGKRGVQSFMGTIAVPVCFYLFYQLLMVFAEPFNSDFGTHVLVITIISGTATFLFFVARLIYILASRRNVYSDKTSLLWKIPVTLVLPFLGLVVNGGFFRWDSLSEQGGIFGDFSSIWFFILTIVNSIVLCLPNKDNKTYRWLLFFARAVTFSFTFYFFVVFLPFLPLSVIAIIAIGTGFLMLAPLLLFVVHVRQLADDYAYFRQHTRVTPLLPLLAGVMVLPLCITLSYFHDKDVLESALAYVYEPDYDNEYNIDTASLQNTLATVKKFKGRRGGMDISNNQIPYLSSYFNWLVLDNMTISEKRMATLKTIFFGTVEESLETDNSTASDVKISNVSLNSTYNKEMKQWESTIDLVLVNNSNNSLGEYETSIDLPHGCWISDYYLYVGDKKEKGILAEKKAATWVYSQIRNINKDPGILYYTGANRVGFKVFPFAENEVRRTGISFIHQEQVTLNIDNHKIVLGESNIPAATKNVFKDVAYVSAVRKQQLKKVKRQPYLHFVVDVSEGSESKKDKYNRAIEQTIESAGAGYGNPMVSFANTYTSADVPLSNKNALWDKQVYKGGFFADRAITKILLESYRKPAGIYPVVVLVTDSIDRTILNDLSRLTFMSPDNDVFYISTGAGIQAHALGSSPEKIINQPLGGITSGVLEWTNGHKKRYIKNDSLPEIILLNENFIADEQAIKVRDWNSALAMQAEVMAQTIHPENATKGWLRQVKNSFASQVMSPHTSYIVVESEAQKAALKRKQDEVLSGKQSLDLGEENRMPEPELWLMMLLLGGAAIFKKRLRQVDKP